MLELWFCHIMSCAEESSVNSINRYKENAQTVQAQKTSFMQVLYLKVPSSPQGLCTCLNSLPFVLPRFPPLWSCMILLSLVVLPTYAFMPEAYD